MKRKEAAMPNDTLTTEQAAARLGVTVRYVYRLAQRGLLEAVPTTGHRLCFTRASVEKYKATRRPRGRPKQKREG